MQKEFRAKLLQKYKSECPLTGIVCSEFLVASHIKRWAESTSYERQDVNNGILLSAHMDRLFDTGKISFDDDGCILFKDESIENLIDDNFRLKSKRIEVNENMCHYLNWHRAYFKFDISK